MNRGVVKISYDQGGLNYQREIFASYPERALVMHFTTSKKDSINFSADLIRPEQYKIIDDNNNLMIYVTFG